MTVIDAGKFGFSALNEQIRTSKNNRCRIDNCMGERFIAAGMNDKIIDIYGISGNALGAYLAGASINIHGNAQDAVGDTMSSGKIIIHGNVGDAAGYAMRGGEIYIKGSAGYRAGVHMKEYKEKKPVIIIGGEAGCFLGEYQAGGLIIVLGLGCTAKPVVGDFPCTGMHGGKMIIRGKIKSRLFPTQTTVRAAKSGDMTEIAPYIEKFSSFFGFDANELQNDYYTVITPNSENPYKQMYVAN